MRRVIRDSEGFTLAEMLIAITLLLIVMSATLLTFDQFQTTNRANQLANDNQERVRTALDQMVRQLRNDATPTPQNPAAVLKAGSYDLEFQATGASKSGGSLNARNTRLVRYCLDNSTPRNEKIWYQTFSWSTPTLDPSTAPATGSCPDGSWQTQKVLAQNLVNRDGTVPDRALFSWDSSDPLMMKRLRIDAWLDTTAGRSRTGTQLTTGVFFRNQDQAPKARMAAPIVTGDGHVLLNGSSSSDGDDASLGYTWCNGPCDGTNVIGRGSNFAWLPPSMLALNPQQATYTVGLTVTDPTGLTDSTSMSGITVPSS